MPRRGPHNPAITWTPHVKVAWGGSLGGGEIWTNSLKYVHLAENTVLTVDQVNLMFPGVWAALTGWFAAAGGNGGPNAYIGQDAKLEWLKINNVTSQGLQYPGATNIYSPDSVSGINLNFVPFYQTFALTLRTQLKRGRAHAGRIFPPLVQPNIVAGTGMCSANDATGMAAAFQGCINTMTAAIRAQSSVGSFCVLSPGNAVKATTPLSEFITLVVADRVPDVQHRRTNRLKRSEGLPASVAL